MTGYVTTVMKESSSHRLKMTECELLNELNKTGKVSVSFPVLKGKKKIDFYNKELTKEEEDTVRAKWIKLAEITKELLSKTICENCKWWQHESITDGYVCCNAQSPYCSDWKEADDSCSYFEKE